MPSERMEQSSEEIRRLIDSVELDNRQAAEQDIKNAFHNTKCTLILKTNIFYFHDGTKRKLLCFTSTVTTEDAEGSRYNISIEIWIQQTHPYSAPICYITPKENMQISSTCEYVDSDGRIILSYLSNWMPTVSSSIKLIHELSKAFTDNPPLYSKPIDDFTNQRSTINENNNSNQDNILNNQCRICFKNDIDCLLLECGHLIACSKCAIHFITCPLCQSPIIRIKEISRT